MSGGPETSNTPVEELGRDVREFRGPADEIGTVHPAIVTPVVGDDPRERHPKPWVLVAR